MSTEPIHLGTVDFNKIAAEAMADRRATSVDTDALGRLCTPSVRPLANLHMMEDAARLPNPIHKLERLGLAYRGHTLNKRLIPRELATAYEREMTRVVPAIVNRLDAWMSESLTKKKTGKGQYTQASKTLDEFDKRTGPFLSLLPGHLRTEYSRARSHLSDQVSLLSKYA